MRVAANVARECERQALANGGSVGGAAKVRRPKAAPAFAIFRWPIPRGEGFVLPYPPTVNTYWRSTIIKGRLRVLLSAKGRAYKDQVYAALWSAKMPLRKRLRVEVDVYPPDRRTRDLDNLLKPLGDALMAAGIMVDDGQIDEWKVTRQPVTEHSRVVVRVEEMA